MKGIKKKILLFICLTAAIELFIFNFRAFESLTYKPVASLKLAYSDNAFFTESGYLTFSDEGDCYIEITGLSQVISNLFLDIAEISNPDAEISLTLSAKDDGNAQYYDLPALTLNPSDKSDKYIKLNLSGEAQSLRITLKNANGATYLINSLQLNARRPFMLSISRMILIFLVLAALYCFRPGSLLYKKDYDIRRMSQQILLIVLVGIQLFAVSGVSLNNPDYISPPWVHHYQYQKLAKALSEGHFYLDDTPSPALKALDNPYDKNLRNTEGAPYVWDTAYYNGKYYVYFGIVPVLLFYLPFYLMTGSDFPTWIGILIAEAAIIIGLFFLLHAIIKKYFKKVSLGVFILMDFFMLIGCGIFIIAGNATFYMIPISMAVALTIWGLYLWIRSISRQDGRINTAQLVFGSLCMALVAGCRPQLCLGSFLALPLFLPVFRQKLKAQSGRGRTLLSIAGFALPYIAVAAFLMYYNTARFGSPFDFGANYNLTTNDMTSRGFHLDRLPTGAYMYLIQPPAFTASFPFLHSVLSNIRYQGITILERMYGGILWLNPFMFSLFYSFKVKRGLKSKGLQAVTVISALSAIFIVFADTEMAGILFRYLCDFGLFLSLPCVLIILTAIEENRDAHLHKQYHIFLFAATAITALLWFLWISLAA